MVAVGEGGRGFLDRYMRAIASAAISLGGASRRRWPPLACLRTRLTYLLLRSNKQSGPYSLQQLVSLGLKPYDLVWLEGKSAAWRYPSEVEGLKAYSPATEEQPYDRFYKKPEEKPQEKQINKPAQPQQETYTLPKEEVYVLPVENKTVTTSRKVFVAMPENHVPKKQSQPVFCKSSGFC